MSDNAPTPSRSEIRALAERAMAAPWNERYSARQALAAALTPEVVLAILADGDQHLDQLRALARRVLNCPCGDGVRQCDEADGLRDYLDVLDEEYPITVSRPTQDGDPREVDRG